MQRLQIIARQRRNRAFRVRKRVRGTSERPRLTVFRSNKHISVQIIDDDRGVTLVSASTSEKGTLQPKENGGNSASATKIGKLIAERAKAKGIEKVCFDRGSYRYHGRIAALADAARSGGLDF